MAKLWLVARQEYRRIAGKKTFLISTLGLPILFIGLMAVIALVSILGEDQRPIGYVDQAGFLRPDALARIGVQTLRPIEIRRYPDAAAATAALEAGELQVVYIISPDYLSSGAIERVIFDKAPSERAQRSFHDFMRANLALQQLPQATAQRLYTGARLSLRTVEGQREASDTDFLSVAFPFAAAILFFISVMSVGGYMLQAVSDEKENRTIEVLMTTLSPEQLLGGKALGLLGVVLTQLALWGLTAGIALSIAPRFIADFPTLHLPWSMLLMGALYFFPSLALISGLMIAIGAAVTEVRQGQQISGILNLAFTFPMFFIMIIIGNPNHPFTVALSLFPTTAFITMLLRWEFTAVPAWQLIISWSLVTVSALLSMRVAVQVFRLGMLQYGQPLTLKTVLAVLRHQRQGV